MLTVGTLIIYLLEWIFAVSLAMTDFMVMEADESGTRIRIQTDGNSLKRKLVLVIPRGCQMVDIELPRNFGDNLQPTTKVYSINKFLNKSSSGHHVRRSQDVMWKKSSSTVGYGSLIVTGPGVEKQ